VLRLGLGYVVSPYLTLGIPRFTLNPDEAHEMTLQEALAFQSKSELEVHLQEADFPREPYTAPPRRGMKQQTLEEMREGWRIKNKAYNAVNPRKPSKAKKRSQDWSEYCDIIRD